MVPSKQPQHLPPTQSFLLRSVIQGRTPVQCPTGQATAAEHTLCTSKVRTHVYIRTYVRTYVQYCFILLKNITYNILIQSIQIHMYVWYKIVCIYQKCQIIQNVVQYTLTVHCLVQFYASVNVMVVQTVLTGFPPEYTPSLMQPDCFFHFIC